MVELGARAAQILARTMERSNARPVTVVSGTQQAELYATKGQSQWESIDGAGMPVTAVSVDWIFRAASWLEAFGSDPDPGMTITEVDGENERTHEVMTPDGRQCFRQDASRSFYRVYSKVTETATA